MATLSTMDNERTNTLQTNSTETTKIDILNPRDLMRRLQEATENTNLFASMQETITLDHDMSRGLEEVELREFIHDTEEPSVRNMLQSLLDLHENEDMLLAATKEREKHTRYSYMVKGERMKNGKFDVLVIRATQAREVDTEKLMVMGLASASAVGIVAGVVNPGMGVMADGAIFGVAALKAAFDFQKSHPDLIYGYVIKDLCDRNLLNILNANTNSCE